MTDRQSMMGALADMSDYRAGDFPDPFAARYPTDNWTYTPPMDANERAAMRLARPYAKSNLARMDEHHPVAEFAEGLAPKEPWQYGLMLAGPGAGLVGQATRLIPPTARLLGAAGAFALGLPGVSDKAEGGVLDKAGKALLAGKVGGPWEGGIRAYHSSPHDFDKFDWSKLRTGEGANVYGAGFYAAENPKVSGQGGEYWRQFRDRFGGPEGRAAKLLEMNNFDRQAAIDFARHQAEQAKGMSLTNMFNKEAKRSTIEQAEKTVRVLEGNAPVGPRTYEVNINARPELLLDWDKPLKQQSPAVYETLRTLGVPEAAYARGFFSVPTTGEHAYEVLARKFHQPNAGHMDNVIASEKLADAGIPGIRYLDQGSRGGRGGYSKDQLAAQLDTLQADLSFAEAKGVGKPDVLRRQISSLQNQISAMPEPSYNYVVTDPSKLDILAKYGIAGGVPMGALAAQDQYQR